MQTNFDQWIASPSGRTFLKLELDRLSSVYPVLSGSMGLQVSMSEHHNFLEEANLTDRFYLSQSKQEVMTNSNSVLAEPIELPFNKNEFAVVAAPHILEMSDKPQDALREIYRVTAPDGNLLITGVNPYSLFGLRCKIPTETLQIKQKFIGLTRLKEWLSVLGFEMVAGHYFHYSGMLRSSDNHINANEKQSVTQRVMNIISNGLESSGDRWLPSSAGGYAVVARKRTFGGTLVGKKTKKKSRLVGIRPVVTRTNGVNNISNKRSDSE